MMEGGRKEESKRDLELIILETGSDFAEESTYHFGEEWNRIWNRCYKVSTNSFFIYFLNIFLDHYYNVSSSIIIIEYYDFFTHLILISDLQHRDYPCSR